MLNYLKENIITVMNYILLTPVRNEEHHLHNFIQSILHQSVLPKIWIILDNSTDKSEQIIQDAIKDYEWIFYKKQELFSDKGGHGNFSCAMHEAYLYANEISHKLDIKYEYIGKTDADVILPNNFFERLGEQLKLDKKLGVVSGKSYTLKDVPECPSSPSNSNLIEDWFLPDELPDKRLYRKAFLDSIGGFPITVYSPDSVILAKARIRGWGIRWFDDIPIYNMRKDTGINKDNWGIYTTVGKRIYYLDYHWALLMLNVLNSTVHYPFYSGLAILCGYYHALKNGTKIDDDEVKNYFKQKRLHEIQKMVMSTNLRKI
mgnify:CR=1 FL=1